MTGEKGGKTKGTASIIFVRSEDVPDLERGVRAVVRGQFPLLSPMSLSKGLILGGGEGGGESRGQEVVRRRGARTFSSSDCKTRDKDVFSGEMCEDRRRHPGSKFARGVLDAELAAFLLASFVKLRIRPR